MSTEDDRKLFIGGFPIEAKEEDVYKEVSNALGPDIKISEFELKMRPPPSTLSRGFCFATFSTREDAEKALKVLSTVEMFGGKINPMWPDRNYYREPHEHHSHHHRHHSSDKSSDESDDDSKEPETCETRIFIQGITNDVPPLELKKVIQDFCPEQKIIDFFVPRSYKETGVRGFGFAIYATKEEAQTVLSAYKEATLKLAEESSETGELSVIKRARKTPICVNGVYMTLDVARPHANVKPSDSGSRGRGTGGGSGSGNGKNYSSNYHDSSDRHRGSDRKEFGRYDRDRDYDRSRDRDRDRGYDRERDSRRDREYDGGRYDREYDGGRYDRRDPGRYDSRYSSMPPSSSSSSSHRHGYIHGREYDRRGDRYSRYTDDKYRDYPRQSYYQRPPPLPLPHHHQQLPPPPGPGQPMPPLPPTLLPHLQQQQQQQSQSQLPPPPPPPPIPLKQNPYQMQPLQQPLPFNNTNYPNTSFPPTNQPPPPPPPPPQGLPRPSQSSYYPQYNQQGQYYSQGPPPPPQPHGIPIPNQSSMPPFIGVPNGRSPPPPPQLSQQQQQSSSMLSHMPSLSSQPPPPPHLQQQQQQGMGYYGMYNSYPGYGGNNNNNNMINNRNDNKDDDGESGSNVYLKYIKQSEEKFSKKDDGSEKSSNKVYGDLNENRFGPSDRITHTTRYKPY